VAQEHRLLAAVQAAADAFVCDTAPLVYRIEGSGPRAVVAAIDGLFDRVDDGTLGCLVSTISAAELLVRPYRVHPAAAAVVDGFLRSSNVGVVPPGLAVAHGAARLVARRVVPRLGDAIVAATAVDLGLPLVTADRRLARAVGALLVQDYAARA
jgi:predicted nucleic acid-binding protein